MIVQHFNMINKDFISFDWHNELGVDWATSFVSLIQSDYSDNLVNFIDQIYLSGEEVYPIRNRLFDSFKKCPLKDVKLVIIDNSPSKDIRSSGIGRGILEKSSLIADLPIELRNFRDCIYETIYGNQLSANDFDNSLNNYCDEGILFLNTSMCVTKDAEYATVWRNFIRNVIKEINHRKKDTVFLFLNNDNNDLLNFIDEENNKIILNPTSILMNYSTVFLEADKYLEEKYHPYSLITW